MRKNFGAKTWLYPMPVFIIGTYDKEGKPNAMNAAWGGICEEKQIMLCLDEGHKTYKNIIEKRAFTVAMADVKNILACDYVGISSGNDEPDKMQKAGFHTVKSEFVDAPVIQELPMALECKLLKINEDGLVVGEIINVSAAQEILDENGKISPEKLNPVIYDPVNHHYIRLGSVAGKAFSDGLQLK